MKAYMFNSAKIQCIKKLTWCDFLNSGYASSTARNEANVNIYLHLSDDEDPNYANSKILLLKPNHLMQIVQLQYQCFLIMFSQQFLFSNEIVIKLSESAWLRVWIVVAIFRLYWSPYDEELNIKIQKKYQISNLIYIFFSTIWYFIAKKIIPQKKSDG